jgi:cell division protein FtsB
MLKSLGLVQIFVLVVVATLFIMTWDFGRRILENVQLVQAAQAADAELAHALQVNAQLQELKKDVTTDDWVIKKARVDLHYAKENETLFIPASTPPPHAAPAPVVVSAPPARPIWQDWLEAIFGTSP